MPTSSLTLKQKYAGLPDKLWQMLDLALADLEAIERQKSKYVVDMQTYHDVWTVQEGRKRVKKCAVCFAGAVMACSLKVSPTETNLEPGDFPEFIEWKLDAVDIARSGNIESAVNTFYSGSSWGGLREEDEQKLEKVGKKDEFGDIDYCINIPEYSEDPAAFKAGIRKIIGKLKRVGL